jgi:hypothetical protein
MPYRSRKDTLAICGRSGIETLKSKLVKDGYFRGLWVLPEYYEPPQPIKYRPKPEVPPYNPQPLIDVYPQTVNLGQISETPPYSLTYLGSFNFNIIGDLLTSLEVFSELGTFTFQSQSRISMPEIVVVSATKIYSQDPGEGYGDGGYGSELYGGYVDVGPDFLIGFNGMPKISSLTAAGQFQFGEGYGNGGYGENGYGD